MAESKSIRESSWRLTKALLELIGHVFSLMCLLLSAISCILFVMHHDISMGISTVILLQASMLRDGK